MRLIAAVAALVVASVAIPGLLMLTSDTTVSSFLPASDPSLRATEDAAKWFGGDPIVVLAESDQPRALLGSDQLPKLLALEGKLSKLPDVAVVYGAATVLNQMATTAQNLLATISGTRDATKAEAEATARANGADPAGATAAGAAATAEFDERYAALLARGLPAGLPTLRNPSFVNAVVFDSSGEPRDQWKFVIPAQNAVAILVRPREGLDQDGTQRLVQATREAIRDSGLVTSRLTLSGSPAIAAELGATVEREIPLLGGVAVLLIAGCYLFIPWTGRRAHRLLPLVATLSATVLTLAVFGWVGRPLSLGVVTFLPIVIGIGSDFPAYLIHGGTPPRRVLVMALASAAGFGSLALSPLPFVRDLGLALAFGVLVAVTVALGLRRLIAPDTPPSMVEVGGGGSVSPPRARAALLAAMVLIAVLGWLVLPRIGIEARPDRLAAGLPSVVDAQHTEDLLGSSGEIEILLRGDRVATPQALAWMRAAEDAVVLNYGSQLRPIVSLPDLLRFLGPDPSPEQVTSALELLPHYITASVLSDDRTQAVVSLGLSLQDLATQRALLDAMRATLPPPPLGMSVEVVGLPVAAARGFELVSQGRYLTNVVGIAAAGIVLLFGLRRRAIAARAVLAAALATGWGLAGAWVLGISLSPLSVALGSLTTATACEFTVLLSYASVTGAARLRRTVAVAALAASLGYLALTVSELSVISDFGLLLAATVGLSLLAAHLVGRVLPMKRPVLEEIDVTPKVGVST